MRFYSPQQLYTSIDTFNKQNMDNNNNNNNTNYSSYMNDLYQPQYQQQQQQQQQQQHGSPSSRARFITPEQSWLLQQTQQQQQQQQPGVNVWSRPSPASPHRSFLPRKSSSPHQFLPLHPPPPSYFDLNGNPTSAPSSPLLSSHHHHPRLSDVTSSKPSPGQGIRRLAEQFLNSLTDESPTLIPRRIGMKATSMSMSTTSTDSVGSNKSEGGMMSSGSSSSSSGKSNDTSPSLPPSPHTTLTPPCASCTPDNNCGSSSCLSWFRVINDDISSFSTLCRSLYDKDRSIRSELCSRTSAAIKSIWPTCVVDVVGSVASNVALPKSDIDFVIYFPNNTSTLNPPTALSYQNTNNNEQETGDQEGSIPLTNIPFYCSYTSTSSSLSSSSSSSTPSSSSSSSSLSLSDPPSQIQVPVDIVHDRDPLQIVAQHHSLDPLSSSTLSSSEKKKNESGTPCIYYGHAGSLIKLIGGRKKSKLLFRSTKIQVFKDINLIRLRDGVSGISMDLWMPVDETILLRSQKHTQLINKYCDENTYFYDLAVVIKTFMQQNLLNSGYSGLGSYGVLLMIIRYIQTLKNNNDSGDDGKSSSTRTTTSLSGLLYGFFKFYCEYDYMNKYISVEKGMDLLKKNADALILANKKKIHKSLISTATTTGSKSKNKGEEYDGDDDGDHEHTHKDDDTNEDSTDVEGSAAYDKFTLMIEDPLDNDNLIICHHKALRNMLTAFTRACQILHPNAPPPVFAQKIPVLPHPASTDSSQTSSPSLSSEGGVPGSSATGIIRLKNGVDVDDNSSTRSTTSSSVFNILIDRNAACEGPAMKSCPSSICNGITQCPIQNKLCFTCGYAFVKSSGGAGGGRNVGQGSGTSPQQSGGGHGGGQGGGKRQEYSGKKKNVKGGGNRNYNNYPHQQGNMNMHMMNAVSPMAYMNQAAYSPYSHAQYYPSQYPPLPLPTSSMPYDPYNNNNNYPNEMPPMQGIYQNPQQLKSMMNVNEMSVAPARATHMVFVYGYQPQQQQQGIISPQQPYQLYNNNNIVNNNSNNNSNSNTGNTTNSNILRKHNDYNYQQ